MMQINCGIILNTVITLQVEDFPKQWTPSHQKHFTLCWWFYVSSQQNLTDCASRSFLRISGNHHVLSSKWLTRDRTYVFIDKPTIRVLIQLFINIPDTYLNIRFFTTFSPLHTQLLKFSRSYDYYTKLKVHESLWWFISCVF